MNRNALSNDLPALPPAAEQETATALKKAIAAGPALAALQGMSDKAGVEIPLWRKRCKNGVAAPSNPKNMPAPRGGSKGA